MAAPKHVPPLDADPMLQPLLRSLAESTLRHDTATPDHLLVLADACDQVAVEGGHKPAESRAIVRVADQLRQRAPDYA